MPVKILDVYADIGGRDTDVMVDFEYHVPPGNGYYGGDVWTGWVHFSETPEPYELEIVERYDAKYGPLLPESLTIGRFHEAICVDESLYIFMRSPEARLVFEPVLVAAREFYAQVGRGRGRVVTP